MCHGFEDIVAVNLQSQQRGGFGLDLGREGLDLSNVNVMRWLRDRVQIITIHACATADTAPGNAGTSGDGRQLCREIAAHTNAEVIAGVQTQYYNPSGAGGRIDFGDWEGPVYRFSPDGTMMPHYG